MDFFKQPIFLASPSLGNISPVIYANINVTKVPQAQIQNTAATLQPDIKGTLGSLNVNNKNSSAPFVTLPENAGSFNHCIGPTQLIYYHTNTVSPEKLVLTGNKENEINDRKQIKNSQVLNISDRLLCDICLVKFSKRDTYVEHYKTIHPNEDIVYTCSICRNQDKDFNLFRNHYYRHFNKGRISCPHCPEYRFTQPSHLQSHKKYFHFLKTESIVDQSPLDNINTIDPIIEKPFQLFCFTCKDIFTDKNSYDNHCEVDHNFYSIYYNCSLCHRSFKLYSNLIKHLCEPKFQLTPLDGTKIKSVEEKQEVQIPSTQNSTENLLNLNQKTNKVIAGNFYGKFNNGKSRNASTKDPTLGNGVKGTSEWESVDSFCSKLIDPVDENQNNNETLNKNYFLSNVEDCDFFENLRYLPELYPSLINDGKAQTKLQNMISKEAENIPEMVTNAVHFEYNNCDQMKPTENQTDDFETSDFLATFDPDDWLVFSENLSTPHDNDVMSNDSACNSSVISCDDLTSIFKDSQAAATPMDSNQKCEKTKKEVISKEPFLNCYICKWNCSCKDSLAKHFDSEHPTWHLVYSCSYCHINHVNFKKYDRHICVHPRKATDTTNNSKTQSDNEVENKLGWTQLGFLFCKECKKKFPKKALYESHRKECHPSSKLIYTCSWCHKHYTIYDSFRSHCYTHSMSGRFRCSYCGKVFTKQSKLSSHEKAIHFGDRGRVSTISPSSSVIYSPQASVSSDIMSQGYESSLDMSTPLSDSECLISDIMSDINSPISGDSFSTKMDYFSSNEDWRKARNNTNDVVMDTDVAQSDTVVSPLNFPISDSLHNNVEPDYINSPESGIDCGNSPLSDIQNALDDYPDFNNTSSTPETYMCNKFNAENLHQGSLDILCGFCSEKYCGRMPLENHYRHAHPLLTVSYVCVSCKQRHWSYKAFYSHSLDCNGTLKNQPTSETINQQKPHNHIHKRLNGDIEMLSVSDSADCNPTDSVLPNSPRRDLESIYLCLPCMMVFKNKADLLDHDSKHHPNASNQYRNNASGKIKMYTLGNDGCPNVEPLSKYRCIQSVIKTSEDMKHSVISNEYNKGKNYNNDDKDVLRCSSINLDINHKVTVPCLTDIHNSHQDVTQGSFNYHNIQHGDEFSYHSNGHNGESAESTLLLSYENTFTGDHRSSGQVVSANNQDVFIVVNDNNGKTEDIQNRDIISNQFEPSPLYCGDNTTGSQLSMPIFTPSARPLGSIDNSQNYKTLNLQTILPSENQQLVNNQNLHLQYVVINSKEMINTNNDMMNVVMSDTNSKDGKLLLKINIILSTSSNAANTNDKVVRGDSI